MSSMEAVGTRASALALLCVLAIGLGPAVSSAPVERSVEVLDAYANLPLTFVENRGQTDTRVRYYAHSSRYAFFVTPDEIVLSLVKEPERFAAPSESVADEREPRRAALVLRFLGRNPQVVVDAEQRAPGQANYFRGNDPAGWHTQLPGYEQVVYRDLWQGVDLMLRGQEGRLKYEFRVRPGAQHTSIRLAYAGADGLVLDGEGGLLIQTPLGVLRDSPPVSYQTIAGQRVPVESRYVLEQARSAEPGYSFAVGAYDPDHELIIDPALEYSTFLGGNGGETGNGIAVDAAGNAYIVGTTQSLDFPTTVGAFDRTAGDSVNGPDVFVSKLNSAGTALIYSTYLGGGQFDFGRAISIDAAGNAYVTGKTQSSNFPTTAGAFDRTANIPETPRPQVIDDVFVTKLHASGSTLVYSTYIGGTDNDEARAIAVDATGNAYVTGEAVSADFPTTPGAFDTTRSGEYDVFVTKLNGGGTALVYSTFLGGLVSDIANDVAVDSANNAFVLGSTRSADFPSTAGAFDPTHNGGFDAFLTRLNPAGSALVYSTFLGGTNGDDGVGLAIDASGNAYVAGGTQSPEFPTTPGAFDTIFPASGGAGVVLKLNPAGSALVFSTFLRAGGASAIVVDSTGNVWLTGGTSSEEFPVTLDAFDLSFNGVSDAIVAKLNSQGSALLYATFLGGSLSEGGIGIARDAADNVYVTGVTQSSEFPTTAGALDRVFNGVPSIFWGDAFVLKLDAAAVSPGWQGPTITALSLSPTEVLGGNTAVGTVTLTGAAPTGGAAVALSDDSPVASVPASVMVPPGATTATFDVTTSVVSPNATTANISATLGTVRSETLIVLASPPLLSAVTLNPSSVVGGNPSTATVHLSAAQSGPTVISIDPQLPSNPVSHPATVTVPAGATSASFTITTTPVTSTINVSIFVRLLGADSPGPSALLLVAPATSTNAVLSSLSLSASSVVGGSFLTGTVTLSDVAPSGGAVVTLSDNSTAATTPSSVTVPAGETSATFILTSTVVFADTTVTLSAMFNGVIRTLTLTVTPAPAGATLSTLGVSPSSLVGGGSATGTVTLSAAAPSGGAIVSLSDNSSSVSVPGSVTVPSGSTSATFTVTTTSVTSATTATITATLAGVTRTATLTVNPAAGGTPGTPSLQSPASNATPAQPVAFNWSDVTNAASYEIQIDDSSTIAAPFVASQIVTVSQASIGGLPARRLWWRVRAQNAAGVFGSFSSTRRFTPQAAGGAVSLSALAVSPASVVGPAGSTGTATLSAAAPTGGAVVTLSDNSASATVPASVTVPAGATSATFPITTTAVTTATPVTITGSFGGATRTATLTVNPAGGQSVTLTVTATGRTGERITSTPAGINVAVGSTGSASFNSGTPITLRVTDDRDAIWSGACSSGGQKTETCTFTITGNASVTGNVQ